MAPKRKAYKFFSSNTLAYVRRGSVRIGTVAGFRQVDGYEGGRADPLEMTTYWQPGSIEIDASHNFLAPFIRRSEERFGIPPGGGGNMRMRFDPAAAIIHQLDGYILCLSREIDNDLCSGMLRKFDCDMYYEISDLDEYADALSGSHKLLKRLEIGKVYYDQPVGPQTQFSENPYSKRPEFAWQKEIRIIFEGEGPFSTFDIEVPRIRRLISIRKNPACLSSPPQVAEE